MLRQKKPSKAEMKRLAKEKKRNEEQLQQLNNDIATTAAEGQLSVQKLFDEVPAPNMGFIRQQFREEALTSGITSLGVEKAVNWMSDQKLLDFHRASVLRERKETFEALRIEAQNSALIEREQNADPYRTLDTLHALSSRGYEIRSKEMTAEPPLKPSSEVPTVFFMQQALINWFRSGRPIRRHPKFDIEMIQDPAIVLKFKAALDYIRTIKATVLGNDWVITAEDQIIFDKLAARLDLLAKAEEDNVERVKYAKASAARVQVNLNGLVTDSTTMLSDITLDALLRTIGLYPDTPVSHKEISEVYAVSPHMYTCYMKGTEVAKKRILEKHIKPNATILIPVFQDAHWTCLIVDQPRRDVYYLDSLWSHRKAHPQAFKNVKIFVDAVINHCRDKSDVDNDSSVEFVNDGDYKFIDIKGRQQPNNTDCGFYMIDAMLTFTADKRAFRKMAQTFDRDNVLADDTHPVNAKQVRKACVDYLSKTAKAETFIDVQTIEIDFLEAFVWRRSAYLAKSTLVQLPRQGPAKRQRV